MTKFVSKENLETLLGAVKNKLDTKITDPGNGTVGQILVKTDNGTEWATPEEVEQCMCIDLTESELDMAMGIMSENDFSVLVGSLALVGNKENTIEVNAASHSYNIKLTETNNTGKYKITAVVSGQSFVTIDKNFTKLSIDRNTNIDANRNCEVTFVVNDAYTYTLNIAQEEDKVDKVKLQLNASTTINVGFDETSAYIPAPQINVDYISGNRYSNPDAYDNWTTLSNPNGSWLAELVSLDDLSISFSKVYDGNFTVNGPYISFPSNNSVWNAAYTVKVTIKWPSQNIDTAWTFKINQDGNPDIMME